MYSFDNATLERRVEWGRELNGWMLHWVNSTPITVLRVGKSGWWWSAKFHWGSAARSNWIAAHGRGRTGDIRPSSNKHLITITGVGVFSSAHSPTFTTTTTIQDEYKQHEASACPSDHPHGQHPYSNFNPPPLKCSGSSGWWIKIVGERSGDAQYAVSHSRRGHSNVHRMDGHN